MNKDVHTDFIFNGSSAKNTPLHDEQPKSMNRQITNLNQTIALSPDVISQEVSGETVLLDLEFESMGLVKLEARQ